MTYDLIYDRQTYIITFNDEGVLCDIQIAQPHGPALSADLDCLPQWLVNKLQQQWELQHETDLQAMRPVEPRRRTPTRNLL